jgi:hypothetical protein
MSNAPTFANGNPQSCSDGRERFQLARQTTLTSMVADLLTQHGFHVSLESDVSKSNGHDMGRAHPESAILIMAYDGVDYSPIDGMIWYSKLNGNRIGRIDPTVDDGDIREWNPPFRGPVKAAAHQPRSSITVSLKRQNDQQGDQTSVLFGSNLGNANAHDPSNLPIILAGGGYAHGRYMAGDESNNTPLCNLFVNLLDNIGVPTESFATSTGKVEL